jgi:dTDP-4-dehydrorhamnose reductase
MVIVVTGSRGMLGTDLAQMLSANHELVGWDLHNCNILEGDQVERMMAAARPQVVIHAAAYTNVDLAEIEPEAAARLNVTGTEHVARAARQVGAQMIYISTDYVFDGTSARPYREDDGPAPTGVYGRTKWQGEQAVQRIMPPGAWSCVRIAWLYGKHGKNFVSTILRLARTQPTLRIVCDQTGAPTYTKDVVRGLDALIAAGAAGAGLVHLTNSGQCTWCEFTQEIVAAAGITGVTVEPITTAELGRPAPRPAYSVLDTAKFTALTGQQPRPWPQGLHAYLEELSRKRPVCPCANEQPHLRG